MLKIPILPTIICKNSVSGCPPVCFCDQTPKLWSNLWKKHILNCNPVVIKIFEISILPYFQILKSCSIFMIWIQIFACELLIFPLTICILHHGVLVRFIIDFLGRPQMASLPTRETVPPHTEGQDSRSRPYLVKIL